MLPVSGKDTGIFLRVQYTIMNKLNQEVVEVLYAKKEAHTVLLETIEHELDKLFLLWTIGAYNVIDDYLEKTYTYESKNIRVKTLQDKIDIKGLDWLITAIIASVIRVTQEQTIQQCVGYLQNFLPHDDVFDRVKTAGELLAICSSKKGLYEIQRNGSGNPTLVKVHKWKILNNKLLGSFSWINNTCFNLPLIEPPIKVTDNYHCGYHTVHESLILGTETQHKLNQNLNAINTLNSIEWVLDQKVLKEPETPSKPLETRQQHEAFLQMAEESEFVYKLLGTNTFWLAWQYDSRGRVYSHGYHVNLQSVEYKKACLSFNKEEKLT